ncbi:type III secretion system translocon subunit SctE [Vibrio profundum]|uniref:type III secretion system translocon subunit SctE n=1 Tax=Vibrio profundum TaxID=2910247 RepID=UPI003D14DA68
MTQNINTSNDLRRVFIDQNSSPLNYKSNNEMGGIKLKPSAWVNGRSEILDRNTLGIQLPEPKERKKTSQEQADKALGLILQSLLIPPGKLPQGSTSDKLSGLSIDSLTLYISLIVTDGLNSRAKDILKALDALHDTQKRESSTKLQDQIDAINKNIEASHQSQKHNIFTTVMDWVVAAAEVTMGTLKIVGGVLAGNPLEIAGGTAELSAGVLGMVKASLETAALCEDDPEKAEKLRDIAEKIGYAQMALEVVAAVLDITETARAMQAASKAARAGEMAANATNAGTKIAAAVAAESAGEITKAELHVILEQIAKELAREMAEEAVKNVSKNVAEDQAKELTKQAAKQAVEKSAETASRKLAKEGLEVGSDALNEAIVKSLKSSLKKEIFQGINRINMSVFNRVMAATKDVTIGAQSIADFAMNRKMAQLRKEIKDLLADQQMANAFLEVLNQLMDKQRTRVKETLKMVADSQSTTQSNIQQLSSANGMMAGMMAKV